MIHYLFRLLNFLCFFSRYGDNSLYLILFCFVFDAFALSCIDGDGVLFVDGPIWRSRWSIWCVTDAHIAINNRVSYFGKSAIPIATRVLFSIGLRLETLCMFKYISIFRLFWLGGVDILGKDIISLMSLMRNIFPFKSYILGYVHKLIIHSHHLILDFLYFLLFIIFLPHEILFFGSLVPVRTNLHLVWGGNLNIICTLFSWLLLGFLLRKAYALYRTELLYWCLRLSMNVVSCGNL